MIAVIGYDAYVHAKTKNVNYRIINYVYAIGMHTIVTIPSSTLNTHIPGTPTLVVREIVAILEVSDPGTVS